ncbi:MULTISPECIES: autorepressor SdpR family transcription factor [Clostridium]|uniref:autorepressor SdpR family transcription factor n=1 Tax=Clostridium sp. TaxID=1506 RepID=UPI0006DCE1EF|nr:autorepressor SdpR family transcription factor [Clostridium disporicum]MBS4974962.1 winged helix-turn-helix transcriptional regulator [Clostridium celatum]
MDNINIFKALSDNVRRDILVLLNNGPLSAGEISEKYKLTNSTISYHLSILKKSNLIYEKKNKNYIVYYINTSVFQDLILWIIQFKGGNHNESI